MKTLVNSEQETIKAAQNLAETLDSKAVILLSGPLGGGKSVFARALIRALTGQPNLEIPSPTFTLLQTYEGKNGTISHYDLYRLKEVDEIYELGWEDSLFGGITIVEWPERLGSLKPPQHLDIRLSNIKNRPDAREIEITKIG